MILAGYILKDKKVFSNFIAPLSLKEKTTLNRLKKFKPNKKVFESEADKSIISPLGDAPKSYLMGWMGSSSAKTEIGQRNKVLFDNMSIISHRFLLYNSEFVLILVIKENVVRTSSVITKSDNKDDGQITIKIETKLHDDPLRTNSDSFESLKSSPENLLKKEKNTLILESLSDFQDDPLAVQDPKPENPQNSGEKRAKENEEKIEEVINEIKSEIVKHFFIRLERGDAGLFFTQFLHKILVKGLGLVIKDGIESD